MLGVGSEDVVVSHQIAAWSRHQCRESGQEFDRLEHKMGGAVRVRGLELVDHLAIGHQIPMLFEQKSP